WAGDPAQRYWMQITDRRDLDGPLLSPKLPRFTWGYDLVSQVQPGDRVLHWWTGGAAPGLVGWSEVEEHATVIPGYTWAPRHGQERTTLGWRAVLGPVHAFEAPATSVQLLPLLDQIVAVDHDLGAVHNGTIYFPLTRYGANRLAAKQEIRAAQAYFVKFPVQLFDVIPGIGNARIDAPSIPLTPICPRTGNHLARRLRQGVRPALRTRHCERRLSDGPSRSLGPTTRTS
ncbi:MAG: hypothetical protein K0S98_3113, partial [Propionibacteriaceae bacterium]|nr:hypothetical protein [Propionibacteriaceae bacterium]